jgi:glycosyltransferase involved in cell wall biosynthesis
MGRLRVLIVCEHASARFGGEAALPLHYFRVLRARGYRVWLITHARTRDELVQLFPGEQRILYVEDTRLHRLMWHAGRRLPAQVAYLTVGFVSRFAAQLRQRKLVRRLIAREGIDVIHQPIPVSPREPSMMYGFGVPVIIGPMNGGMQYPPSFRRRHRVGERWLLSAARATSSLLNWLMPGKRHAALLLVANERTRRSLPAGVCPRVAEVVENGVDLGLWSGAAKSGQETAAGSPTTFAFVGRLVDWKGVDLLLHAFKRARGRMPMRLLVIGDGQERSRLEALARKLGILARAAEEPDGALFMGWLSQTACARELQRADCLVLSSLFECGGAVVLEAMSMAKPVIATEWGGPADYLDASCGVLVPPTGREQLIEGFAEAMIQLASSPALRVQMGSAGRDKVVRFYDWEIKVDRILELYRQARMFAANGTWTAPA